MEHVIKSACEEVRALMTLEQNLCLRIAELKKERKEIVAKISEYDKEAIAMANIDGGE